MNSKITLKNIRLFLSKAIIILMVLVGLGQSSYSQIQINEGFNTAVPLPTGWASQNLSSPVGSTGWFQGSPGTFPSFSGAPDSYIAANYQNVSGANTISNWLFTPTVTIANGNIFSFYTRTTTGTFPDRLELRMSTNGASVNAGATSSSVGDFTNLLVEVNPGLTNSGYPVVWTKYTVTITGVAAPVTGRFAFRYFVTDGGSGNNSDFIGIDDVLYATPCTGTPAPGNTISSVPDVCSGVTFTLSFQNALATSTYQWQSGPSATGPWTNISGATGTTVTLSETASTYYQVVATCTPSGLSAPSTPLLVPLSPASQCYCQPAPTNCTFDDEITNVTLGTINNNSACGTNGFTNYSIAPIAATATTNLEAGSINTMKVTVGPGGTEYVGVWIDYNKNVIYEANEFTALGSGNGVTITGSLNVPATALTGITRMRVRVRYNTALTGAMACSAYTFGETEDYQVTILPCAPINITAAPANVTISCGGKATIKQTATGTNLTYQWQQRVNSTAPWTTVTDGGLFSGATTHTLVIDQTPVTFNGYQYRLFYSGPCTPINSSAAVTLTVNPLVTNVVPSSQTLCAGTIQKLTIGNISTPSLNTVTFSSGTLNAAIPDATPTGLTNVLAVSGIPAGAVITDFSVKLNVVHPSPGFELVAVVKAPNNAILNLDYATSAQQIGGANFTNTVISSSGTNALGGGTAPWTGIFKADAQMVALAPFAPTGPTGYAATTPNFSDLYVGGVNGNWTFGIYDFGTDPGSTGTLTDWSITITYLSGAPALGVWGPITTPATIFTDAAATIPYTGTPINEVWVKPTVTTNYTANINTGACTGIATIPVTVNNPITGTSTTSNKQVCIGGTTSFTATAPTTGNTISHQWKVSTDAGVTYTNVANGGVYSGATTTTLTITGATASMNNYRYKDSLYIPTCNSFVNTNASTLTVSPIPVVVLTANPTTQLYPGLTTTLSAAVNTTVTPGNYTWYRNGIVIPGATGNTRVVDVDGLGDYTVSVNDVNACGSTSGSITISSAANDILFIYPSPNSGQFQVRYYSGSGNLPLPRIINIYDNKGARVFSQTYTVNVPYTQLNVNMTNAQTGIYSVELLDGNGLRIKTGRVAIL